MSGGNQHFKYDIRTKQIINVSKKLCLQGNGNGGNLELTKCDETLKQQRWIFNEFMNETALKNWNYSGRPFQAGNSVYWDM